MRFTIGIQVKRNAYSEKTKKVTGRLLKTCDTWNSCLELFQEPQKLFLFE